MSYDLYFYRKKDNPISKEKIYSEFKELIPIDLSEVDTQIHYENERTGVYFLIDINEANTEQEDIELFDNFEGFENTNISASINFLRADYFGREIFPIIGAICEKLDLYIFNPQEFDETRERPLKWTSSELVEHWTDHNAQVSRQQFEELELKYYPKEKSDKIWEYTSMIDTLENEMDEDIYIPNLFMIMNQKTKDVFSYVVWSQSIPLILPKVDFIILVKNYKKLFKKIEEIGIVKYEDVVSKFTNEFEKFNNDNVDCLILKQRNADRIKKEFNSFPIWKSHQEFGTQIGLDNFVNHK
ncbi:hypothetical protein GTQ34_16140 [Muricauda sp. JGD-17]|uniref:Uncharacterized protein n=1 Tax=Flagellimonas ochracea TaxID=2696472 RepID=A0A964WYY3_9FLAO|nr:hypothetical protein [Allomuricauda ochracea]NAY93442.1 hypothetical protein [Allomuricauda ochracea]